MFKIQILSRWFGVDQNPCWRSDNPDKETSSLAWIMADSKYQLSLDAAEQESPSAAFTRNPDEQPPH